MEETLKKLTDQIYNDGVEKANKRAEEIIKDAEAEEAKTIASAQKQTESIKESKDRTWANSRTSDNRHKAKCCRYTDKQSYRQAT